MPKPVSTTVPLQMPIQGSEEASFEVNQESFVERSAPSYSIGRCWIYVSDSLSNAGYAISELFRGHIWRQEPIPQAASMPALETVRKGRISAPVGIPNRMNSCYRIASNQALKVFAPVVEMLRKECLPAPGESIVQLNNRNIFRQALVALYDAMDKKKGSEEIYLADMALSHAVASSGLGPDFDESNISRQQDAAGYVEMILGIVLNDQHEVCRTRRAKKGDIEFSRAAPKESFAVLQVALEQGVDDLQALVDVNFGDHEEVHPDSPWKPEKELCFDRYTVNTIMASPPKDIMAIQLKRFAYDRQSYRPVVDRRLIRYPQGDIIDFSKAYGQPTGTTRYSLKSFVCHLGGSADSGHYISYVKKDGQWYFCNDNSIEAISQAAIDRAKKHAYLIFLEKA